MKAIRVVVAMVLGALLMVGTPVQADARVVAQHQGIDCAGFQVQRCLWVNFDTTNNRLRGYASVQDTLNGSNYDVAVNNIQLQELKNGRWVTVSVMQDYDGWNGFYDEALSGLASCSGARKYRVVADFWWRAPGTSQTSPDERRASKTFSC